jgi:hypothetical protein
MKLERAIELLHRSSERLTRVLALKPEQNYYAWWFLRRESWLHLRLSVKLWLKTIFLKKPERR